MAGKRSASYDLNHDNWDQEDTPEEAGTFNRASKEVLKKRVFKTAKRRITQPEEGSLNVFNPVNLAKFTNKPQSGGQLFGFLSKIQPNVTEANGVNEVSNHQGDGDKQKTTPVFSFGNKVEQVDQKINSSTFGTEKKDSSKAELKSNTAMFSFNNQNSKNNTKPDTTNTAPKSIFGGRTKVEPERNKSSLEETNNIDKKIDKKPKPSEDKYYAKLKGLNESVAKWISTHVESNPLINLQPIFKDYESFFKEIENERQHFDESENLGRLKTEQNVKAGIKQSVVQNSNDNDKIQSETSVKEIKGFTFKPTENKTELTSSSTSFNFGVPTSTTNSSTQASTFKFGVPTSTTDSNKPSSTFKFGSTTSSSTFSNTFKFGIASTSSNLESTSDAPPKFSFGATTPISSTGFGGFSNSAPLNFGTVSKTEEKKDDEESDEPPKVDVEQVEEEGHIYTIRCKLFVKKDGNFVEKGIGSLFLKPVPESDKVQVIVRAHNSLGNILSNFILSSSIPTQRMGKNNVMIVCIPTPDSQPPPVPVLIKVKTAEDADQLLETLEKHKK